MADQDDQLMRRSPLNRPARRCCWYSLYHKYIENNCVGYSDGVDDDYDYRISHRRYNSVAFSSGYVCKTRQCKVYHVELESQCKVSLILGPTF